MCLDSNKMRHYLLAWFSWAFLLIIYRQGFVMLLVEAIFVQSIYSWFIKLQLGFFTSFYQVTKLRIFVFLLIDLLLNRWISRVGKRRTLYVRNIQFLNGVLKRNTFWHFNQFCWFLRLLLFWIRFHFMRAWHGVYNNSHPVPPIFTLQIGQGQLWKFICIIPIIPVLDFVQIGVRK